MLSIKFGLMERLNFVLCAKRKTEKKVLSVTLPFYAKLKQTHTKYVFQGRKSTFNNVSEKKKIIM